jgi:phosphoenolpyruvate carboxylase|tara:strand:+ start:5097 stop:7817 length:2721 start_codon:yes stop_codon:yes gene_type:complete
MKNNQKIKTDISIQKISEVINLIGTILGLVIKEQEGARYYKKVEKIRKLSKLSRTGDTKSFNNLKSNISNLTPKESLVVARSFNQFLNLSNLVESLYSVHKVDDYDFRKAQGTNEFIILENAISDLLSNKSISKNQIYETSKKLKINLVLTAHPTEIKRRTLIKKYAHINNILEEFNNSRIFTQKNIKIKKEHLKKQLHAEITSIWKTDEIKRSRPTPIEEARWGIAVIEGTLWNAIPKITSRLSSAIDSHTGKKLPIQYSPIKFGSWIGGDRDGNPYVTRKITEEIVLLSRWSAANLYEKELTKLIQNLSMHECSKAISKNDGRHGRDGPSEPYRVFLRPIRDKMKATQVEIELYLNNKSNLNESLLVQSINELLKPLTDVYRSLCSVKCEVIANGLTLDLIRRAHAFGLNLAKLDIRQSSDRHQKFLTTISTYLGMGKYKDWSEENKISFLSNEFLSKRPLIPKHIKLNKEDQEVWDVFQMLSKLSKECFGSYIISMASNVSDILAVIVLQKEAGVKSYLNIVPLFETFNDLKNSEEIIKNLYTIPWYLQYFKNQQEIMIGYSDSSKDVGKLAASWAQYYALEKLQKLSNKFKVKLTFFHGRGGSVGRGGGPVYTALLSQPPGTVNASTKITEQGEIIQQKYGTESLAENSLGTYIGSVLLATLKPPIKAKEEWKSLMNEMSEVSSAAYNHHLYGDKNFLRYFDTITPQKSLEKLFAGSRPPRRSKSKDIKNLRAIPWMFSWTQMRFILPSWLGMLEGLQISIKTKNKKIINEMLNKWPFFYAMMDMLDMVLVKTDQRVVEFYEDCLADSELKRTGANLRGQLTSLINLNRRLIPKHILHERNSYRESIKIRNTYSEILNLLQADMMKKLNSPGLHIASESKKLLNDTMMVTIAGISAAMKNTG